MNQSRLQTNDSLLHKLLKVYRIEPIGYLLSSVLQLPLAVIWFLFVFIYFGIMLILHNNVGTPLPATFQDLLHTTTYYPNLFAIAHDLIGSPLVLTMLVLFRTYIPAQFIQLEQSEYIQENNTAGKPMDLLYHSAANIFIQAGTIIILPACFAAWAFWKDIQFYPQQGAPAIYALVFLSVLSRYARLAVLVQIAYLFLIINRHRFSFALHTLHLNHPDQCSGLAPFGNLATSAYVVLFVNVVMEVIAGATNSATMVKALGSTGTRILVYSWILFPCALGYIFALLIYKPHRALKEFQRQYLLEVSTAWTEFHQHITVSIRQVVKPNRSPFTETTVRPTAQVKPNAILDKIARALFNGPGPQTACSEARYTSPVQEYELLETWEKLNQRIENMHTWPIRKQTTQILAIVINPLVPVLMPVLVEAVRGLLP